MPEPAAVAAARVAAVLLSGCAASVLIGGCGISALLAGHSDPAAAPGPPAGTGMASAGSARSGAASAPPTAAAQDAPHRAPLTGVTVGIDPGHNGLNYSDPSYLNHLVWNGRESEACDTTGTQTDSGYTEPRFTWAVADFLRTDLIRDGARVVMTRRDNRGVGPCVDRRAQILNRAHAAVSLDIHADGGPAWGRGFSILEPIADGPNDAVIGSSRRLGRDVRAALLARTPMPVSDYYGHDGVEPRSDLAGLNLTTEPKVLIECGNMRNSADAALLTSRAFQRRLAAALARAVIAYLRR